ncbi:MAG TPA: GTP 3',8-cyclase MoaA [Burkholderiaceae bacterium]|nr:GTP 3',8-cyclase MoaA [Burkholderiaceae bacterium]
MTSRVIPLIDSRVATAPRAIRAYAEIPAVSNPADQLGRPLRDLRISVTDRCNFRCTYCMPKEVFDSNYRFLRHSDLLTFEEIARLAGAFVQQGVEKIRLTGGEPLLRKDLHKLIAMLSLMKTHDGQPLDIALTTNGSVLARKAQQLADAGLKRITVSLDGLDDATFRRMNDVDFPVRDVLAGIDAAAAAGLAPVKINMVVKRGVNEREVLEMARYFRGTGHIVRFIEYMDVGTSNGWRMDDVVPSGEVLRLITGQFALEPIDPNYTGEVAERWRYRDGQGEIGVISSVSQAFCRECTRARLSTDGKLYLCLFAHQGHDLRALLRGQDHEQPLTDAQLEATIAHIWRARDDRYSELRMQATAPMPKVEMSYIGG